MLSPLMSSASAAGCDDTFRGVCDWLDARDSSGTLGRLLQYVVVPILVFVLLLILGRLTRRLVGKTMHDWGGDPQIRTLIHNVITVGTWVLAIFAAFAKAGLSLSVLLTFGGVISLAIGLAFQDLLRNVLAGIFLLVEHPFRIGDLVMIGEQGGTVETISLRTTVLRTTDGRLAVLPNLAAFTGVILNSSAFDVRQFTVSMKVPEGHALEPLMRRCRMELRHISEVARNPAPSVLPRLEADVATLDCRYYVDFREYDSDLTSALVAQRLYAVLQAAVSGDPLEVRPNDVEPAEGASLRINLPEPEPADPLVTLPAALRKIGRRTRVRRKPPP